MMPLIIFTVIRRLWFIASSGRYFPTAVGEGECHYSPALPILKLFCKT
jgi:hypothetical protein